MDIHRYYMIYRYIQIYKYILIYIYNYMYPRWLGGCFTFFFSGLKVSSIQWYQGGVDFLYFGESGDGPKASWLVAVLNERVCRNLFDVSNFFILYMKFVYLFQVKIWNKYVLVNCWDIHPLEGWPKHLLSSLMSHHVMSSSKLLRTKGCLRTFKSLF